MQLLRAIALESSSDEEDIERDQNNVDNTVDRLTQQHPSSSDASDDVLENQPSADTSDSTSDHNTDFGLLDYIDSSSESILEETEEKSLKEKLATWSTTHGLSKFCIDELLKMLRSDGNVNLPKDSRTLLQTPKLINYEEKCGGQYIYFGMNEGLESIVGLESFFSDDNSLKLNFNIDGILVFKSTGTQFWPILCSVGHYTPFIVAIFYGSQKSNSREDYLSDFIRALHELSDNGITIGDTLFTIYINAFICDAPARAFLKNIKGHTGLKYNACERCMVRGYWKQNRVILHSADKCSLRTDKEFSSLTYLDYHQHGETPSAFSVQYTMCNSILSGLYAFGVSRSGKTYFRVSQTWSKCMQIVSRPASRNFEQFGISSAQNLAGIRTLESNRIPSVPALHRTSCFTQVPYQRKI